MTTQILTFEAENAKRLKAVDISFKPGLNVLGGRNAQGKTTVIDIIMSLVRGEKYTPSNPVRDGEKKGRAAITLSNGAVIEANYTSNGRTALRVKGIPTDGGPQTVLDGIFGKYSLDVREFLGATDKRRNEILLGCVGVDLTPWQERHKSLYEKRTGVIQSEKRAKGHYESMPYDEEVGDEPITAKGLLQQNEAILRRNAERENARRDVERLKSAVMNKAATLNAAMNRTRELAQMYEDAKKAEDVAREDEAIAKRDYNKALSVEITTDESTAEIEAKLAEIDETNAKIRQNQARSAAEQEWKSLAEERDSLTCQIETNKREMMETIQGVDWPVEGLSVGLDGSLSYNGQAWDCMSTAEQYKVATAIQAKVTPEAMIVLVDRLEVMDDDTLAEFAAWCDEKGIQVVGTRVCSNHDGCDWLIEDGMATATPATSTSSKKGGFSLSI